MLNNKDTFEIAFFPLGEEPDNPDDLEKYLDDKAISMSVKDLLCENMVPELRNQFDDLAYSDGLIHELILKFDEQWTLGQFEYFDKFLSTMMEENTDVGTHLDLMEDIYDFLTEGLDYWIPSDQAVSMLLCSLPPSYSSFVDGFVREIYWASFHQVKRKIRDLEVDPVAGEVIEGQGIFDILKVLNVKTSAVLSI